MRQSSLAIFAFFLSMVLAAGCDSDKAFDPIQPSMTLKEFPHAVGNWWRYELADGVPEVSAEYDTVLVTIVDSIGLICWEDENPGGGDCRDFAQLWELRSRSNTDTMIVYFSDSSMYFAHEVVPFWIYFPFSLGDSWVGVTVGDTAEVIDVDRVKLESGQSAVCYIISGDYWSGILDVAYDAAVAENIGLVELRLYWSPLIVPDGQRWRLLDWQVR
ncbi:MAG: hypothetical protein JSW34_06710 [Candidatus Zixiibacteriota bacterium]|nr:MAG: hypothetical protein JSW34_06710 [candidate division Zixibacteria bacterium]